MQESFSLGDVSKGELAFGGKAGAFLSSIHIGVLGPFCGKVHQSASCRRFPSEPPSMTSVSALLQMRSGIVMKATKALYFNGKIRGVPPAKYHIPAQHLYLRR